MESTLSELAFVVNEVSTGLLLLSIGNDACKPDVTFAVHCIWLTFGSSTLHHALHPKAVQKANLAMQLMCMRGPIYRSQRSQQL